MDHALARYRKNIAKVKRAMRRAIFPISMNRSPRIASAGTTGNRIFFLDKGMCLCNRLNWRRTMDARNIMTTNSITWNSLITIVYTSISRMSRIHCSVCMHPQQGGEDR